MRMSVHDNPYDNLSRMMNFHMEHDENLNVLKMSVVVYRSDHTHLGDHTNRDPVT